jgi:hypothetical protein
MILILIIVIALVAWALHLMEEAMEHREFSLMLAGFLVASSAAALVGVYFLMGGYVGYLTQTAHHLDGQHYASQSWLVQVCESAKCSEHPTVTYIELSQLLQP